MLVLLALLYVISQYEEAAYPSIPYCINLF